MNDFEKKVHDALQQKGVTVLRNGWPDFLVIPDDGMSAYGLELKRGADRLSPAQQKMRDALSQVGISTYVKRPSEIDEFIAKCRDKNQLDELVIREDSVPKCAATESAKTTATNNHRATNAAADILGDGLATVAEAAAVLGISRAVVYSMIHTGKIVSVNLPGQRSRRIPKRALIEFASRGLSGAE